MTVPSVNSAVLLALYGDLEDLVGGDLENLFGGDLEDLFGGDLENLVGGDLEDLFGGDLEDLFGVTFLGDFLRNGGLVLATIFGFLLRSSTAERKATLN